MDFRFRCIKDGGAIFPFIVEGAPVIRHDSGNGGRASVIDIYFGDKKLHTMLLLIVILLVATLNFLSLSFPLDLVSPPLISRSTLFGESSGLSSTTCVPSSIFLCYP